MNPEDKDFIQIYNLKGKSMLTEKEYNQIRTTLKHMKKCYTDQSKPYIDTNAILEVLYDGYTETENITDEEKENV